MGENYSVAIDLGGTIIKIGLILDSEIVRFTTISSDSVKGLSHMLPKMEHAIDSLLSEEGISSTDLASIGLAFPGMVNPVECRVISTNDKYDDACDIDLCHWADSRWGVPFVLENDARLAVIGEWLFFQFYSLLFSLLFVFKSFYFYSVQGSLLYLNGSTQLGKSGE